MAVTDSAPASHRFPRTVVPAAGPHRGFRPDIEGMRAIAVTAVVLSHVGLSQVAGGYVGVDVFFVVSGFLITTLLLNELGRTGRISLTAFYARRAVRLLPASTLALAATVAGAWLWLSPLRFSAIATDAFYATFYGINWRLAHEGVQYQNTDAVPSPLQHFWSLAVEEQYYLAWPLLMLTVALAVAARRGGWRRPMAAVLGVITAASLLISVVLTRESAPWAYFGSHTRAWELGVGALVALAANRLARLSGPFAAPLTWAGLAAVVLSALLYDEQTPFPGSAAALPVFGAAAMIAGGCAAPPGGAVLLLRTSPFQLIGRYSYSWYLWHWPVLMIGPAALDMEPSVKLSAALAAGALLIAAVFYHLVENPFRTWPWIKSRARRGLALGLGLTVATAFCTAVAIRHTPAISSGDRTIDTAAAVAAAADPEAALARLLSAASGEHRLPSNLRPTIGRASADKPIVDAEGCHLDFETVSAGRPCVYGDPNGTETIYLLGDSHATQWFTTVNAVAHDRHWRLMPRVKSSCQAPDVMLYLPHLKRAYHECTQWRDTVLDEITATRPDMVLLSSNGGDGGGIVNPRTGRPYIGADSDRRFVAGWKATLDKIKAAGAIPVLILDTPWPAGDNPQCLAKNPDRVDRCGRSPAEAISQPQRRAAVSAAARERGAIVIDTKPWFCTDTICPAVVGNLMVWRDYSHISAAYAAMLTPVLAARLPD